MLKDQAFADGYKAGWDAAVNYCANIADACQKGVAVEHDGQQMLLGDQKQTALAIAFAIRNTNTKLP